MDWRYLFLSPQGRIGRRDFWLGVGVVIVAGLVLGMIPLLGLLASIALIYPSVCLQAKRLHDFGKSGWLQLVPLGVMGVASIVASVTGGAAALAGGGAALAGLGLGLAVLSLALLINLGFLLWVGLSRGDVAANSYGPPADGLASLSA